MPWQEVLGNERAGKHRRKWLKGSNGRLRSKDRWEVTANPLLVLGQERVTKKMMSRTYTLDPRESRERGSVRG